MDNESRSVLFCNLLVFETHRKVVSNLISIVLQLTNLFGARRYMGMYMY